MKRFGYLWPQITDFSNLLLAARKAQKGKRFTPNVLKFNYNLETELLTLQQELLTQTYHPCPYYTFEIFEPKRRLISAAPYRDRVVHHALCNIIIPLIEPSFIFDSYANRIGKGSHRALKRCTQFARTYRYVLQCDLQKYFPSIDHRLLKAQLRTKLKCPQTLWLMDLIIDNSNEQPPTHFYFPGDTLLTPIERRQGLPIGNLTSQFLANFYLNGFDHFVTEQINPEGYLRYVDDFLLFSNNHHQLQAARQSIEDYLTTLRLKLHPIKSQLYATRKGVPFLGFRALPDRIRVRNGNLRRARHRLTRLHQDYNHHRIELDHVIRSLQSWEAHLKHGDTWHLRQHVFRSLIFTRSD